MQTFEILLALLAVCIALAAIAQRLDVPVAVVLVLGGMALALIPGLPDVTLAPELALALFLPPLLQVSAYRTDWPAFKSNLGSILLLAVGAVFFTALTVAVVSKLLIPDLPWWAAIALGAIVAPPDAVAASSILKQAKLPRRIVTVLEGESLINDASSLVLYRFAVAAALGASVSFGDGAFQFLVAALGGTVVGLLVGYVVMGALKLLEDTLLDITVSLLAGYAAYFAAETVHVSGVLAAVACGLTLGRKQHVEFTAKTRIELTAVWGFVEFILTAMVFMLIGLQLRGVIARLERYDAGDLALLGASVSLTLIISRFLWVFASALVPRLVFLSRERTPPTPWNHAAVLSWSGMRGVVSLAAAIALPVQFPGRDIILFLACCAILSTLVLQGTTLSWLIAQLGVSDPENGQSDSKVAQVRAEVTAAALDAVKEHVDSRAEPMIADAAIGLVDEYQARAELVSIETEDAGQIEVQLRLRLTAIEGARAKLSEHTDAIEAEAHRLLAEELDLEEQQIRRRLGDV